MWFQAQLRSSAVEHEHHADEQYHEQIPHVDEVREILIGLHVDTACVVVGEAILQEHMDEIGHKEHQEWYGSTDETPWHATADILIVYIVHDVEDAQHAGEEHHGGASRP